LKHALKKSEASFKNMKQASKISEKHQKQVSKTLTCYKKKHEADIERGVKISKNGKSH